MREQLDPSTQISDEPYDVQCVRSFREALTRMAAIAYNVHLVDIDAAGQDPSG